MKISLQTVPRMRVVVGSTTDVPGWAVVAFRGCFGIPVSQGKETNQYSKGTRHPEGWHVEVTKGTTQIGGLQRFLGPARPGSAMMDLYPKYCKACGGEGMHAPGMVQARCGQTLATSCSYCFGEGGDIPIVLLGGQEGTLVAQWLLALLWGQEATNCCPHGVQWGKLHCLSGTGWDGES